MNKLRSQPWQGLFCLAIVIMGLALGHALFVTQKLFTGGVSVTDTLVSAILGIAGIVIVWTGLNKSELRATLHGYLGANLIWVGIFEWTWEYFGHFMGIEPVYDDGMMILSPGLLVIQSTVLLVLVMLVFFGANKDTRCRMFMWFHRNLKLRPGRMTAGYKRQHARNTAIETVFLIWFIYQCAIFINDPRLIRYDSIAAMLITGGFVVWGVYLARKLTHINGFGAVLRYAIPTGSILWLPIEAFSRWGLYPEIWIKPAEYPVSLIVIALVFAGAAVFVYREDSPSPALQAS
jgi:hypothetical protein